MGPSVSDSPDEEAAGAGARGPTLWIRLAPLLLVAGLAPWLCVCVRRYVDQPLNGDTGIFQYVAWCLRRGERLYDTIAMPDGPFVYLIHVPVQLLFGHGEWRFRACDVGIHAMVAAGMGALLAGARAAPGRGRRAPGAMDRAVGGACTACIWLSSALLLDWYASALRDAYYALFGSLGLVLAYAAPAHAGRARGAALFFAGFLPALVTFGKHSGVIYLGLAGLTVLLGPAPAGEDPRRRLRAFFAGAGAGLVAILGFVAVFGSLGGLWFWYFVYPLRVYRYLFVVPLASIFGSPEPWRGYCHLGLMTAVAGLAAVGLRILPRRAVGLCLAPSLQVVAFLLQQKAWMYQCHPILLGAHIVLALGLITAWGEACDPQAATPALQPRLLAWVALLFVYGRCLDDLQGCPWLTEKARPNVTMREQVAGYLAEHTRPDDRVFYYGIDPYTLFLAQRLPAVAPPVSFLLDFTPALALPAPPQGHGPDAAARARIQQLQPRVAADACARLVARPPAAVVLTSLPPNTSADAMADVVALCPALREMLDTGYRKATTIDKTRVYLRSDRD